LVAVSSNKIRARLRGLTAHRISKTASVSIPKSRCRFWPPAPGFIEFHILNRLGDFPDKRCTRILD
jgi:hypothetical protein